MIRALLIALVALAVAAPAASAHATLEGTTPARGAELKRPPDAVTFRFSESVEANFGAIKVYDAKGERVDDGKTVHPGGRGDEISTGLKSGLPDGAYTATYRVISADSHPVSGGVVFNVGKAGAVPAASVADLLKGSSAGPATEIAFGIARGLDYLAIALALGGLGFLFLTWGPGLAAAARASDGWPEATVAFAARARRLLLGAVVVGVISGVLGIVLQGATAAGTSFWSALDPDVVREVLGTRFGTVWGLRVLAWIVLGAVLVLGVGRRTVTVLRPAAVGATGVAPSPAPSPGALALLAVPCAFLAISPALAGHATTQSPVALLFPLDVIHVLAMSLWIGGLVSLLFVVPAATARLQPPDRSRLLASLLLRFSPLALGCVIALLLTGVGQSIVHVRHFDALLHTAFGRAVLIKFCLFVVLVGLGAVNRQRVVPRLRALAAGGGPPGGAGRLLRSTLRAEVALTVAVIGVTAALVSYAPPTAVSSGPFSKTVAMGPLELQTTVDPASAGANAVHLYLFDAKTGAQFDKTKQLTVKATLADKGIALPVTVRKAGPGHYVSDTLQLATAGDWKFTVTDRISDFDEYATTITVPVK